MSNPSPPRLWWTASGCISGPLRRLGRPPPSPAARRSRINGLRWRPGARLPVSRRFGQMLLGQVTPPRRLQYGRGGTRVHPRRRGPINTRPAARVRLSASGPAGADVNLGLMQYVFFLSFSGVRGALFFFLNLPPVPPPPRLGALLWNINAPCSASSDEISQAATFTVTLKIMTESHPQKHKCITGNFSLSLIFQ